MGYQQVSLPNTRRKPKECRRNVASRRKWAIVRTVAPTCTPSTTSAASVERGWRREVMAPTPVPERKENTDLVARWLLVTELGLIGCLVVRNLRACSAMKICGLASQDQSAL